MSYADQLAKLTHIALENGVSVTEIIASLEMVKQELAFQVFYEARQNPPSPIVTPERPNIIT